MWTVENKREMPVVIQDANGRPRTIFPKAKPIQVELSDRQAARYAASLELRDEDGQKPGRYRKWKRGDQPEVIDGPELDSPPQRTTKLRRERLNLRDPAPSPEEPAPVSRSIQARDLIERYEAKKINYGEFCEAASKLLEDDFPKGTPIPKKSIMYDLLQNINDDEG